jgi:hypothetical protein
LFDNLTGTLELLSVIPVFVLLALVLTGLMSRWSTPCGCAMARWQLAVRHGDARGHDDHRGGHPARTGELRGTKSGAAVTWDSQVPLARKPATASSRSAVHPAC